MPIANDYAKRLRLEANLTQQELANWADLDARTISRFETGGRVSLATASKIAAGLSQALGIAVETESILIYDQDEFLIANSRNPPKDPLRPSEQARRLLDDLRTNRSYDFLKLIEETKIPSRMLRALMDEDVPVDTNTAQKIIDYIENDAAEQSKSHQNNSWPPRTDFEETVRRALRQRGLSQEDFAHEIGVSPTTVSRWLNAYSFPTQENLSAISKFLGVSLDDLEDPGYRRVLETPKRTVEWASREEVKALGLSETAASIPDQSPLVRFGVSENAKLSLIPTLADENDYDTIKALRSELLAAQGPIEYLKERYAQNPNVPQADLFGLLVSNYHEELSKDPKDINYIVLYVRGARFYSARRRAAEQVTSGEWPELDAKESEAIDSICDHHGPLIMASAVGRKVVEDAHQYEVPPDVYAKDQELLEEFSQVITTEPGLMEPEDAEAYREMSARPEGDPQPARTRVVQLAITGSALVVIVGGVALLSAGGSAAAVAVPLVAGYGASKFFWEVAKKTDTFKRATDDLASRYDSVTDRASQEADRQQLALLQRMKKLVDHRRDLFEKVANIRPEFGWAKKFIALREEEQTLQPNKHIILIGQRGSGKTATGQVLARRLGIPLSDLQRRLFSQEKYTPTSENYLGYEEEYVSDVATKALAEILASSPSIVEVASGFAEHEDVWKVIQNRGIPVWIAVDDQQLWLRKNPSVDRAEAPDEYHRLGPILSGKAMIHARVTDGMSPDEVADTIIELLKKQTDIFAV